MSSAIPLVVNEATISHAWGRVLLHVLDHPGTEISPLVISVDGFHDGIVEEESSIRAALDKSLRATGQQSVETVAGTIFPKSVWRLSGYDRQKFYKIYKEDAFPSYQEACSSKNRRGLYFQRLIDYGRGPHDGNQLEQIISEYTERPGVRRSMFQASIFDPGEDHVRDAQLGFPCLQHISVIPSGKELTLNAFYATQQLFDKAYGNLLGLSRLGHFLAGEMKLEFTRLNVFVGIEKLERIQKRSPHLDDLRRVITDAVAELESSKLATAR